MAAYADAVELALVDEDPWHGFCEFIERVCAMQAEDRGFTQVLTMTFPAATEFEHARSDACLGFAELIDRAKQAGRLRPDFCSQDLVLLLMANAGVVAATGEDAPESWRRLVGFMLQAFAAEVVAPLPPAPESGAMYRAMVRAGAGVTR